MHPITIPTRLNGPPTSGHGGATSGLVATATSGSTVAVSLRVPPPLGVELTPVETDDSIAFVDGDRVVATVAPATPPRFDDHPFFGWNDVKMASDRALAFVKPTHPFPTCFGCGFLRPDDDGLALYAGPIDGTPYLSAPWVPSANIAADGHTVDHWAIWAALDCPSGWATFPTLAETEAVVLGTLTVDIRGEVRVGERYQVVSKADPRSGRKIPARVAVVAPDGTNVAVGEAMWITIPIPG